MYSYFSLLYSYYYVFLFLYYIIFFIFISLFFVSFFSVYSVTLCCSVYYFCVWMCSILLPAGVDLIAFNKMYQYLLELKFLFSQLHFLKPIVEIDNFWVTKIGTEHGHLVTLQILIRTSPKILIMKIYRWTPNIDTNFSSS
jgi:hypothetical protein